ncbi:unnamed protein product [Allacma fusca]|uniref:Mediator of RNA polymerase II transcription subunit 22 n=1 Tax=Allacma fusca TaxID=39272 RepID=A0A8J2KC74_9HEXA|nr:unnamed protein product [Allacma fusca]
MGTRFGWEVLTSLPWYGSAAIDDRRETQNRIVKVHIGGVTMAQSSVSAGRALPQNKEALLKGYNKRLKDNVKSIVDNFAEIVKLARIESEGQVSRSTQADEDHFEMSVRAANMVRAGEGLMKLVADIKQYLILNDFPSVNEAIVQNSLLFKQKQMECDRKLMTLRDDMAADMYDLEEEYYSSSFK